MRKYLAIFVIAGSAMYAQTAPAQKPAPATPEKEAAQKEPAKEIPPEAAVITINGLCPNAPAADAKSPDCKTVVTRAEFEKLLNALAPNAPPNAKQQLAGEYMRVLVLSSVADKMGLENSPQYAEIMKFMRMRVLAQSLMMKLQEESKPSATEVQKYYQENPSKYEEISLKRVFIPRNRPTTEKGPAPKEPTDAELQAEGEKAKTKLQGGASFEQVQKEVYESAGFKTPPPPTSIPNWRYDAVPPAQKNLFSLKKGDFSNVMIEPAGAYVYRVEDRKVIPLDDVKAEIETQLASQNMQKKMEELTGNIKPDVNQAYMQGSAGGEHEVHAMTPKPAPATSKAPAPKAGEAPPKK